MSAVNSLTDAHSSSSGVPCRQTRMKSHIHRDNFRIERDIAHAPNGLVNDDRAVSSRQGAAWGSCQGLVYLP
jgi:hypothetical protein